MNLKPITIILVLLASIITGVVVWKYQANEIAAIKLQHENRELAMKLEVANAKGDLNQYKLDFETNLREKSDELQTSYESSVAAIHESVASLNGYRLQDPHRNSDSISTGAPGSTSGVEGTDTGGGALLSEQASQFLFHLSGESDIYLGQLRTCRAWAANVESEYNTYKTYVDGVLADLREKGLLIE